MNSGWPGASFLAARRAFLLESASYRETPTTKSRRATSCREQDPAGGTTARVAGYADEGIPSGQAQEPLRWAAVDGVVAERAVGGLDFAGTAVRR